MRQNHEISLNFFPLTDRGFKFTVYRKLYNGERSEDGFEDCQRQKLPVHPSDTESYTDHWVSFNPRDGFEAFTCKTTTNHRLTRNLLYHLLTRKCTDRSLPIDVVEGDNRKRVNFVLKEHQQGREVVWLEPYFLKSTQRFGFLADFRFRKAPETEFNREVLQLSLSLDKDGRDNRDFYVDRFEKLHQFIREVCPQIFPLELEANSNIDIKTGVENIKNSLESLSSLKLDMKTYVFADPPNEAVSNSQFKGVRSHGPLRPAKDDALLYFLFYPEHKSFSYDLYWALQGKTYATFPGMEKMFNYSLDKQHVGGVPVEGFEPANLERAIKTIKANAGNRLVVPIIIVPWNRNDPGLETNDKYYRLKHLFLKHNLPTQLVTLPKLQDKNTVKWAISDIALGVFSKMGGHPWKVQPRNEKCLIIGIGKSHRFDEEGQIERFFAYSVLTDSSGLYKDLKTLGRSDDEETYLKDLRENLCKVLEEYTGRFDKFAIHTPFSLQYEEMEAIQEALDMYAKQTSRVELVVLKFNDDNKFFGYALGSNSLVPYESSYVELSNDEFLVWFEGLQYHNPSVKKRVGRPVHIQFVYPRNKQNESQNHHPSGLTAEQKRNYLQDAANLSGANWRGFNAKSLPVSMYYAQLISRFFKEFNRLGLEEIELDSLTPWFL
jgi:hypothetical protein